MNRFRPRPNPRSEAAPLPRPPRQAVAATLLALCTGLAALPAVATDWSQVAPVVAVPDAQVSVGRRQLNLPAGQWHFVSYLKGRYFVNGRSTDIPVHTGYFADVAQGRFRMGVVLELSEIAMQATSWTQEPCALEGKVFKSGLESTPLFPECLVINSRNAIHKGATGNFYPAVSDWLAQQRIEQNEAVYDIWFMHFSATGQGRIRVYVPVAAFASPQAAIEWAQQLPVALRPLFQGRTTQALLPARP